MIVHVCRVAPPSVGGMERVIGELAGRQAMAGRAVRWVTTWPGAGPGPPGVEVVAVDGPGALARALRDARVVHVHGVDALLPLVRWARPPGARVGVSTHGLWLHGRGLRAGRWAAAATLGAAALRLADRVWFTSEVDRRAVAAVNGEVVPDGVDTARWGALERRPQAGRWVVPGRVDRHKGHGSLLTALAGLRRVDRRPLEVEVVGGFVDGGLEAALRAQTAALGLSGVVRWAGRVDDAAWGRALSTCELALFPSTFESFGLALVEAMAAGVAPVASPILAHRMQVRDGHDGDLVDLDAPTVGLRLAALREVGRAEREARARASASRWGWDRVLPRWDEAYAG